MGPAECKPDPRSLLNCRGDQDSRSADCCSSVAFASAVAAAASSTVSVSATVPVPSAVSVATAIAIDAGEPKCPTTVANVVAI